MLRLVFGTGKERTVKTLPGRLTWLLGLVALMLGAILASSCTLLDKAPVIDSLKAEKDYLFAAESDEIHVVAHDPNGDELSYEWQASGGDISGQGETAIWTAPDSPDTYTIAVRVTDGRGGEAEMQLSLDVLSNNSPVIESLTAQRTRANRGEAIVIECLASDADGDSLAYIWSTTGGSFYGTGSITAWLAPTELGSYTVSVAVTDGKGGETSAQLVIDVMANHPPVIESLTATDMVVIFGRSTDITCAASDPDGDELAYSWNAAEGEISGEGSAVMWTAPDMCGEYVTVTVTVFDDRGAETSGVLSIQVRKPG
jgi:hypothetical protein